MFRCGPVDVCPTRTEAIFAALQGPVLSLSSTAICMYRSYTLELLLPRRWRLSRSLSSSALCSALADAQVVRADKFAREPVRCDVCGPVLAISDVRSNPDTPDDLESFCATVRTRCTSSRRHLHVRELAVVVALDEKVCVASPSFVIFARDRRARAPAQSPRDEQPPCCDVVPEQPVAPPCPELLLQGQGLAIVVDIMRPVLPPVLPLDCGPAMWQGMVNMLQTIPGFLLQKSSVSCDMIVVTRAYRTAEDAERGIAIASKYSQNILRNPLNVDTRGSVEVLAFIKNW
eukprot:m51a1_g6178 hypothetical protein (288) ;mRNA; f:29112-30042